MIRWILGCFGILLALLALVAFIPQSATTNSINFTRYLWNAKLPHDGAANRFQATPGAATLAAQRNCDAPWPKVVLNGTALNIPEAGGNLDIALALENQIDISQANTNCLSLRITQLADATLHVLSRVHFNTNVSNFERSREFYGKLGFTTLSGFPDTNTQAMARAIGIQTPTSYDGSQGDFAGGYLLHGELIGPKGFAGGVIDLIEFTVPRNTEPPYASLNHLGMARAVMHTRNLDRDLAYLAQQGITVRSPAITRADGSRFAIFTDPDGTSYELLEEPGAAAPPEEQSETTYITRLGAVNVNVSDFKRSSAWYRMLGYEVTRELPNSEPLAVANAMGFAEPWQIQGAIVTHNRDGSTLELVQWDKPYNDAAPYALPVNHLGMHRMAFSTSDIAADVAALKAQGVEFVSPITPCCSGDDSWGAIVAFYDPDGTVLELVEQPLMTPMLNLTMRLGRLLN